MKHEISPIDASKRGGSSFKLILSYVFDWLVILVGLCLGAVIGSLVPNKRPFSLENPELSYPFQKHEKVPSQLLALYCLGIPAVIILTISLVFIPGPTIPKSTPRSAIWNQRMWEMHVGLLGLCLSLAITVFFTGFMKNMFGKPRPDLLSRCIPDLANLEKFRVGGLLRTDLVSADICQQTDSYILNEGFRSYPSGHSSFASGGMIYLSLYIASKLGISIPYLSRSTTVPRNSKIQNTAFPSLSNLFISNQESDHKYFQTTCDSYDHQELLKVKKDQAAAPPLYLLIFATIPFSVSIYIASTRYSDFRHHGFDILFGYMIGVFSSIFSFRFYHLPIGQGAGWAWGPRSSNRSFWSGVGIGNYVGSENDFKEEIGIPLHFEGESGDIERQPNTVYSNAQVEQLHTQARLNPPIDVELLPIKNK